MNEPENTLGGDANTLRPQTVMPRSTYVHIPFCRHRCGYCNFTLVAGRDYLVDRFLSALETEIGWLDENYQLDTLFLGGGTPSHLSPEQLDRLSSILNSRFKFNSDCEITAECNPNDLSAECGRAMDRLGVNRISLGVQSLNAKKLERLERDHTLADIENAIRIAREFANSVSLDLIFAAPDETSEQWETDIDAALSLNPDHLSTYELTFEKGKQFWKRMSRGDLSEADEELRAEMYQTAIEKTSRSGLAQYEISSFAKPGQECRHNLAYWSGVPYFAFGPGAARFIDGIRETNHQSTTQYLKLIEAGLSPAGDREQLAPESAARERLAIGLRMVKGLNASEFHRRTGFEIESLLGSLTDELVQNGLLVCDQTSWRLTQKGIMLCDWISAKIVEA